MQTHRPLSAWVARVLVDDVELGAINDGDERADARHMDMFVDGWRRESLSWQARPVLALRRSRDGLAVVELDGYGRPMVASPAAVEAIRRTEQRWPHVEADLGVLAQEPLPLRYWLLERLDDEGEPPDEVFAILPWELLDRAVASVSAALVPGGALGELVEMRHWLTPAVRGLCAPIEQLDHGLRTDSPDAVEAGTATLLANLRDLPLARIPGRSLVGLGGLVSLLGAAFPEYRVLADTVARRLADVTDAVPDDVSSIAALVLPLAYLNGDDPSSPVRRATLAFEATVAGDRWHDVVGRISERGGELQVTLTGFDGDLPVLTVEAAGPGQVRAPMHADGRTLRGVLPWAGPDLPERLIFRTVAV